MTSLLSLYREECHRLGVKPNSLLVQTLPSTPGQVGADQLLSLDLSTIFVGRSALRATFPVLQCATRLRSLNISGCNLDNEAIVALCDVLRGHPSLATLDLSRNPFSQQGARALLMLARTNPSLTTINVMDTLINPALARSLLAACNSNRVRAGNDDTVSLNPQPLLVLPADDEEQVCVSCRARFTRAANQPNDCGSSPFPAKNHVSDIEIRAFLRGGPPPGLPAAAAAAYADAYRRFLEDEDAARVAAVSNRADDSVHAACIGDTSRIDPAVEGDLNFEPTELLMVATAEFLAKNDLRVGHARAIRLLGETIVAAFPDRDHVGAPLRDISSLTQAMLRAERAASSAGGSREPSVAPHPEDDDDMGASTGRTHVPPPA